ncbi:MAG: AAA family ATPase [Oscillospiraceae bacterium]|jgi:septum site-determining protein MinD|nr:AAA family ATPase [Oscillospiraceae bacterium]
MQNVTVITSAKGGVGKSTMVVSLGAVLADKGKKVLLVDGDSGLRNLDFMLGVSHKLVFDLSDIIRGNCRANDAVLRCEKIGNLFLLPATQRLEYRLGALAMRQLTFSLSERFDYVIIDCPAGIGQGFVAAIAPAAKVLVVATADPISVKSAGAVSCRLDDLGACVEKRLIVNKFSKRRFIRSGNFKDLDEVVDLAGMQLLAIVPENECISATNGEFTYLKGRKLAAVFEEMSLRFENLFKKKVS